MPVAEIISICIAFISLGYSIRQTKLAQEQTNLAKSQLEKSEELFSEEDELLESASDVTAKISQIILEELKRIDSIDILNYGLDLETVMPWFKNKFTISDRHPNGYIKYKALIIDDSSHNITPYINGTSNIKSSYIAASIESANAIEDLPIKNIELEIRAYDTLPIFHGFLINEKHLFISFTEVQKGKIVGGVFPYMYFQYDRTSKLNSHYFRMFMTWFNTTWDKSLLKAKVSK